MKQFMDGFEEAWSAETERRSRVEQNIVEQLQEISRVMTSSKHLPSLEEYEQLQADLKHKRFEKDKSEATAKSLELDNVRLQSDLNKVNQLEEKLRTELEELKVGCMTRIALNKLSELIAFVNQICPHFFLNPENNILGKL